MYPSEGQSDHQDERIRWNTGRLPQVEAWIAEGQVAAEQLTFLKKRLENSNEWLYLFPNGAAGWYTSVRGPNADGTAPIHDNDMPRGGVASLSAVAGLTADGVVSTPLQEKPWFDAQRFGSSDNTSRGGSGMGPTTTLDRPAPPERRDQQYTGHKRMAARFAELFAGKFIHTPGQGWMKYTGSYWEACSDAAPWNAVEMTCRHAIRDAGDMEDKKSRKALLKVVMTCESESGTKSVLAHAKRWDGIAVDDTQLDAKPGLFAVNNGVLDLYSNGQFRRAQPGDLLTMHGNVAFDPEAECPTYDGMMELYQPDPEIRDYLHRLAGAAMEGKQNLQNLITWFGETAGNGKGTTERAWARVFGTYCRRIPVEALVTRGKFDQYKDEKAKLRGARLVFTTEPSEGMRFSAGTVKSLTGGDPVTSREVYKSSVTFDPTWLVMMSTNARVSLPTDFGMQRRLKEVPWEFQIPRDQMSDAVEDQLAAEASGILNRFLAGWLQYQESGIAHPQSVEDSTQDYFRSVDPLRKFIEECLEEVEPTFTGPTKDRMYQLYRHWCQESGERFIETKTGFGRALLKPEPSGPGFEEGRSATMRYWKGYQINPDYQQEGAWMGTPSHSAF